jgi:hypothetical protein
MAQEAGSLNRQDIEYAETRMALDAVLEENQELRRKLTESEASIVGLQKNLATGAAESEIFRRQAAELKLRIEALGLDTAGGNVGKRLLEAVSNLKLVEDERKQLSDALIRLSEAVIRYQKVTVSNDPEARLALEVEMRGALKALGVAPPESVNANAVNSSLTDGMVISIKDDLALVVANLGRGTVFESGCRFRCCAMSRSSVRCEWSMCGRRSQAQLFKNPVRRNSRSKWATASRWTLSSRTNF